MDTPIGSFLRRRYPNPAERANVIKLLQEVFGSRELAPHYRVFLMQLVDEQKATLDECKRSPVDLRSGGW